MLEALRRFFKKRETDKILQKQGFLVYCQACGVLLNRYQFAHATGQYGVYSYICESCGKTSAFDMLGPVPVKVGGKLS